MNSKKSIKFLTALFPLSFMIVSFALCKFIKVLNKKNDSPALNSRIEVSESSKISSDNIEEEMHGVWVPYIDLELNSTEDIQKKFENKFNAIINQAKHNKINTLIVHVRSHSDALYPSKIFPWSHIFTGTQDSEISFDPLKYMVEESHKNGLKFHAWINPLRVKSKTVPSQLSKKNPYFKLNSEKYTLNHKEGIYYNPGFVEVQNLIIDGIKEIIENYDVDGIHFDDYFYPPKKDIISCDSSFEEYVKTEKNPMTEYEWRQKNINELIQKTYQIIKQTNSTIQFGISPPGIISKCYEVGADVKLWISQKGYVDYICPQVYWSIDFNEMPFEKTAKEWKSIEKNPEIKIYSGLALYKIGTDLDKNTWKNKNDIIKNEIQILRSLGYDGFILYSSKYLNCNQTEHEIKNYLSVV